MAAKGPPPGDVPFPQGIPKGFVGQRQADGTPTTHFTPPMRSGPGYSLSSRESAPPRPGESGIERSMRELADAVEKPRRGARPILPES